MLSGPSARTTASLLELAIPSPIAHPPPSAVSLEVTPWDQNIETIASAIGEGATAYAGVVAIWMGVAFLVVDLVDRAWLKSEARIEVGLRASAAVISIDYRGGTAACLLNCAGSRSKPWSIEMLRDHLVGSLSLVRSVREPI